MNLEQLPIIGPIVRSRREEQLQRIIDSLPKQELSDIGKKSIEVLGGILDIPESNALSTETTVSKKLLKANKEWVFRNNDVIAMEVSKIEFELYQLGLKDGEITFTEVESHPLLDLLDKPNAESTKADAIYILQSHKKLTGDAFWLKIRSGRSVVALRPLPPDRIKLNLRSPTPSDPTVIENFEYNDVIDGEKVHEIYDPNDIIHIKKPNVNNYFRGQSTVEAFADTIDVDNLTNHTTMSFFKKGAITNFVLSTESKVSEEQIKRIQADMKHMYAGASNAYRTMVLGGGLTPQKLSFSNKDMEFLAQLAWYRDKIMSGFGNTLASLGMLDDVNRATHESAMVEWKRTTIKPDMDSIVGALNDFLVPEFGNNLILGYTDPIPEDRTDDVAAAKDLYSAGIITLNEAREVVDYEPVEEGDSFYSAAPTVVPANEVQPEMMDDSQMEDENNAKALRMRRKQKNTVPRAIAHISGYKALLRSRGIYLKLRQNKELKEAFKPVVERIIREHQKKGKGITIEKALELAVAKSTDEATYIPPHHAKFSSDEIMNYYYKQIHDVEVVESHFEEAIVKYLKKVNETVIDKLAASIESKKSKAGKTKIAKDAFDDSEDDFITQAQIDFTPLLDNLAVIAGQDAYKLVGITDPYLPSKTLKSLISTNVEKFTKSMLDTDRDHIINIITDGINEGLSVGQIRDKLVGDDVLDFNKKQAMRITRTEVLRASQQSAIDAWKQSGVVEGKMWITAGATDECADYEGKIEKLGGNFYSDTSEFMDGDPPLHPNCRCSLVPIVVDTEE